MPRQNVCIFCGPTDRPLTAEHLIADWVSWALHPTRKSGQFRLSHRNLEGRNHSWLASSINYKAKLMCGRCNNEIFSSLEDYLKPLITPMMLRGDLQSLDVEAQVAITAWVVKTLMVHNHIHDSKTPDRLVFSAEQRLQFRDTLEPPEGVLVAVWLAHFVGDRLNESAPIAGILQAYDETRQDLRGVRTFVFSFAIGQFAVQALAILRTEESPPADWLLSYFRPPPLWDDATLQIWPCSGHTILWPPPKALVPQSMQAFYERFGQHGFELWPGRVRRHVAILPMLTDHAVPPRKPRD